MNMSSGKIVTKKNPTLFGDSQTQRILELLGEYNKDSANYHEVIHKARQLERRRLTIRRTLAEELKSNKLEEFDLEQGDVKVKLVANAPRAIIDSENKVPSKYTGLRYCTMFDMQRIKSDLADGQNIPGVRIEPTEALEIDIMPTCKS